MALYLVTGQPGHGKTAYALDKALKFKAEGRAIYAHGVKDLDYDKAGFLPIEDPTKWQDLPDGSVVLLDECYTVFPNRNPGAKVPDHVEAMARHRHRGFDFILIAQQGLQLDPFLRGLYEEHVHVRQTSIFKSKTKLKRWNQYQNNVQGHCADVVDWIRPKHVFELYTSTTMVTTKRTMPMWLRWLLAGVVFLVVVMIFLKWHFDSKMAEFDAEAKGAKAAALPARGSAGAGVAANPQDKRWDTLVDYAKDHQPRFGTMPWTAPIFDQRPPMSDPQIVCMSSTGGNDAQGHYKAPSCTCYTEQSTLYEVSEPDCRTIARNGPQYNPYRTTQPTPPPAVQPMQGQGADTSIKPAPLAVQFDKPKGMPTGSTFPEVPAAVPGGSF